jgi:hypothetical protein
MNQTRTRYRQNLYFGSGFDASEPCRQQKPTPVLSPQESRESDICPVLQYLLEKT